MAKKIYAVKQGLIPGIYMTWPECEKQVKGYKGAEYKSFTDPKEAEEYVFGKAEIVQEAVNKTIKLDADETAEFMYLLDAIKNSDSRKEVKELVENIEDLLK